MDSLALACYKCVYVTDVSNQRKYLDADRDEFLPIYIHHIKAAEYIQHKNKRIWHTFCYNLQYIHYIYLMGYR